MWCSFGAIRIGAARRFGNETENGTFSKKIGMTFLVLLILRENNGVGFVK